MSYLRRVVGVLALFPVMTALTVFGGGERERYQGEDFDKYACVTLRELQRVPTNYKATRVRFIVRYHRTENLWAPFYTPFTPEDHLAFSGWAPEKKLWNKEDHLSDFPFLYIDKECPDLNSIIQAPPYQVLELYSIVRNDFNNIPWIEVMHVVPCKEPLIHDELLHHMIKGLDAVKGGRMEEGLGHLHEALHHDPPLDAAVDIHIAMAKAYLAQKDWHEASCHANNALELCPHHPDAEALLSNAETMLHAAPPAPPAEPPAPVQPKAPEPPVAAEPVAAPEPEPAHEPVYEMTIPGPDGRQPASPTEEPKAPEPATPVEEAVPPAEEPVPPAEEPAPPDEPQPPAAYQRAANEGVIAASVVPPVAPPDEPSDAQPAPQPYGAAPDPIPSVAPAPDGVEEFREAVADRDRKIADLGQALEDARRATDEQVEGLRAEVARLQEGLAARDAELAKQVNVSVDLEGRLRDALAKLETAARESASADARVREAQQELAQARAKLEATEDERNRMAAALEQARALPNQGDEALATLQARVADLEAENALLRGQVAEIETLRAENAGLTEQNKTLFSKNVSLELAVKDLQDRLAAVATTGDDGAVQAANDAAALLAEKNELAGRLENMGAERNGLAAELQERAGRIADMQQKIQGLEAAVQQAMLAARANEAVRIIPVNEIAAAATTPAKPRGRWVGFDCRPPEVVREEIRRYREWLDRTPGAAEAAVEVEDELLEPGMASDRR